MPTSYPGEQGAHSIGLHRGLFRNERCCCSLARQNLLKYNKNSKGAQMGHRTHPLLPLFKHSDVHRFLAVRSGWQPNHDLPDRLKETLDRLDTAAAQVVSKSGPR